MTSGFTATAAGSIATGDGPQGFGAFDAHHPPARALLDDCVHCGFCLPACPTYRLWGDETDSPRGRLLLMGAALGGDLPLNAATIAHWDACLGCMACMPACPSGVHYDRLIEATRQQVERLAPRTRRERAGRAALFAVLPYRRRVRALGALAVAYRASGAQRLLRRSGLLDHAPARLRALETLTPRLRWSDLRARPPRRLTPAGTALRLRVVLLEGCVGGGWFAAVGAAAAHVLAACGCEVRTPPGQGCCGALELHAGREAAALRRARALIARVEESGGERIVVTSAGCGSAMKEYAELLADDPAWRLRAARFAAGVRDISEVLDELGPPRGLRPLPLRVAYADACHLAHAQRIRAQPRAALAAVPGLEVLEIPDGDMCCGSAGVYNLLQPATAAELGRRKAQAVSSVGPDCLAAGNPGCLVQIGAWLEQAGTALPAFHPVELLAASLQGRDARGLLLSRA